MKNVAALVFNRRVSLGLMIAAAVLGSFSGLGVKEIDWNPMGIVGVRSGIACLLMLLVLGTPKITFSLPQIGGAVSYSFTLILFVIATKLTTAANAALLLNTAPIYVALLGGLILGERTTARDWTTTFFVAAGLLLFFIDKLSIGGLAGNVCAALSGVTLAFVGIFMRMQKDGSPLETFLIGNGLTFVISIPWLHEWPGKSDLLTLLGLGVVQLGIADILYAISIKNVSALESKLIYNLKPILNAFWVLLFVGEVPGKWAIVGGAVVLVSVTTHGVMSVLESNRKSLTAS